MEILLLCSLFLVGCNSGRKTDGNYVSFSVDVNRVTRVIALHPSADYQISIFSVHKGEVNKESGICIGGSIYPELPTFAIVRIERTLYLKAATDVAEFAGKDSEYTLYTDGMMGQSNVERKPVLYIEYALEEDNSNAREELEERLCEVVWDSTAPSQLQPISKDLDVDFVCVVATVIDRKKAMKCNATE